MKRYVVIIAIALLGFTSCRRGNTSWRYLIRSASKATQIEDNENNKSFVRKYDFQVISLETRADTLNRKYYMAKIVLPPDTLHYYSFTSIGLPATIGIADVPKAIVKAQYFLHNDTNNVYATRFIEYDKGVRKN